MTEGIDNLDPNFFQLIFSLQAGAMQYLGKVASPITGKIERDLNLAKSTIDMLEMLQKKTQGNLNDDEKRLLEHVLYELRMNYVDETKKEQAAPQDSAEEKAEGGGGKSTEKPDSEEKSAEDSGETDKN